MVTKNRNRKRKVLQYLISMMFFVWIFGHGLPVFADETEEVYLKETEVAMTPATTKKLKLVGAAASKIKWSSSNTKVAEVNDSGKVTAKAKGKAVIKAVYNKLEYSCKVVVSYGTFTTQDGMCYEDIKGTFGCSGRWFKKSIGGGKYSFTNTDGSTIYFKVTGSKYVNINFASNTVKGTPYFAYSVDGGSMKRSLISKKKISVGNTKTHYVRLVVDATSEYENRWGGEAGVAVKSVQPVSKNGAVAAVRPQNGVIAFYGDSISKGVRTLNWGTPSGTSATHSYSWYCAAQLDMVPYFAGFGSAGIVQKGTADRCYNVIKNFSLTRKADAFDAEVVVIEHGTNDVFTHGSIYVKEYKKVLDLIHKKFPKAQVMAMIPLNQIHADEIKSAASPYKKWCTVVETSSLKLSYTDGIHPSASGSKKMGKYLAKKIAAKRKVVLK